MTHKSVLTNKFIFEQMINFVIELHNKITKIEHMYTLTQCLKELYTQHKETDNGSWDKEHFNGIILDMCNYTHTKCDANKTDVYETWMKIVFDANASFTDKDVKIYNSLKEFFFGTVQTYQIIFEHKDRRTGKGRYYYVLKLMFNEEKISMYVAIQDLKRFSFSSNEKDLSMITNSFISDDGYIVFDVSNETLLELAQYTFSEFDNCGFQGGFELYPRLTMSVLHTKNTNNYNNRILQDYFSEFLTANQYNNKLMNMLEPF
jgi:hypothetical protein